MRHLIYLLLLITTCEINAVQQDLPKPKAPALVDPKDVIDHEIKSLDHMIAMNKQTLDAMEKARETIASYKAVQLKFLERPEDKERLFYMTKAATQLQQHINSNHLNHLFSVEFIRELNMLANIYKKNQLPRH